jgi:hypothetical protein
LTRAACASCAVAGFVWVYWSCDRLCATLLQEAAGCGLGSMIGLLARLGVVLG